MTVRLEEIKNELKSKLTIDSGTYVENSKIAQFIDVLSYHYLLLENDNNLRYQNQFIDSVLYEQDLISILNQLGINRDSYKPNIATLNSSASARGEQYTGEKNGNIFNFYSFSNTNVIAEGSFNTWNFTVSNINNNEYKLANSERLYIHKDSLKMTSSGSVIYLYKDFTDINDSNHFHIHEDTDGNYIVRVNKTGSFVLEGFLVGSPDSLGISTFTKVSNGTTLTAYPSSYGYSEKHNILDVRNSIIAKMNKSNRAISIADFNRLSNEYFPSYNLYFYESDTRNGVIYFSNKLDTPLNTTQILEVKNLYEKYLMIPGIILEFKYKNAINWKLDIEVLLQRDTNNATNQTVINNTMISTLNSYNNNISLFKFMQTMYDSFETNIVDIKINKSVIEFIINDEYVVNLNNIEGNIKIYPYIEYTIDVNKVKFPIAYSGKMFISNVLSPVTFAKSDYIKIVPTIYFKEI